MESENNSVNSLTLSFNSFIQNQVFFNHQNNDTIRAITQSMINSNLSKNIDKIINEISDIIKCYICLDKIREPKMCQYCHRLACGRCIESWLREKNICGFCRHRITRYDFIKVPFMENIQLLLDNNKDLDAKREKLEDLNKKLKEEINSNRCQIHNEKILYYCINCNKKLCGKCTSFFNKEAKIHKKHKVFEFSEIEKSNYINVINLLENMQKQMNIIKDNISNCEEIQFVNNNKLNKEKIILDIIYKEIEGNYKEKNFVIKENSKKLEKLFQNYDEKFRDINNKLQEIDSLDKPLKDFNVEEEKKYLEKYETKLLKVKENIEKVNEKNIFIEFKSFNYVFTKNIESIINEKNIKLQINNPIEITFFIRLIKKDTFGIIFPIYLDIKKDEKERRINFIPFIQINNKIYSEFQKEKKSKLFFYDAEESIKINSIEDEEDSKDIKNLVNIINFKEKNEEINNINYINNSMIGGNNNIIIEDNEEKDKYEYILYIKTSDLIKGENKFDLFIYYYSFYN